MRRERAAAALLRWRGELATTTATEAREGMWLAPARAGGGLEGGELGRTCE